MEKITVWTKQHQDMLRELERTGRHVARREYILQDLKEDSPLVLETYDWLARHSPDAARRPPDADYPVWVSFQSDAAMLPGPGFVILELEIDPDLITEVNIAKWGTILNYSYIPQDEADARRHKKLLADYGVSDTKAYMSQFYPQIKREIVASWDRLFDDRVQLGNPYAYGTIWEVRQEWVRQIKT